VKAAATSASASPPDWRISAVAVGIIVTLTLWHALGGPGRPIWGIAAASVLIVMREYRRIPRGLVLTALILAGLTAALLPLAPTPGASLEKGLHIGALLVSLVASVSILGRCALRSSAVAVVGDCLLAHPPRRRYLPFTVAAQLFAAMLSLAGTNLLFAIASRDEEAPQAARVATFSAITRGFSAATFWSPMFGNMSILLALYPTLDWLTVFPVGFGLAQLTVLVGTCLDRLRRSHADEAASATPWPAGALNSVAVLLIIMLLYLSALVMTSTTLNLSITASIVLLTPIAAVLINVATAVPRRRIREGLRISLGDLGHLPAIAPELVLFMAAGCAGTIIADAIPGQWIGVLTGYLATLPWLAIVVLMMAVIAFSTLGVHPVLSAVLLASTLTPSALALPALPHFSAVLVGWGLAVSLTPFSVVNLAASRLSGIALMRISVGANWHFTAICLALAAFLLSLLALN
jgi:hypothetical protein